MYRARRKKYISLGKKDLLTVFSNFVWICFHQCQCSVFQELSELALCCFELVPMEKLNPEDKSHMLCWHNYTSLRQAERQQ